MRSYILTAFATIFMVAIPSVTYADLIVEFPYTTDVTFEFVPEEFAIEADFSITAEGGGLAGKIFNGVNENAIVSGDYYRMFGNPGNGENPVATIVGTFSVTNNSASAADLIMSIQGGAIFNVSGSPNNGDEYSVSATQFWTNFTGNEGFNLYNKTVTSDYSEGIDWPAFDTWAMTLAGNSTADFSVSIITETSGGMAAVPEPSSLVLMVPLAALIMRRKRA